MAAAIWLLRSVRRGISPATEANTSRYVHRVLVDYVGWPFDTIVPQPSKRGFVDYDLGVWEPEAAPVRVEVKRFGAPIGEGQIRKYLVLKGPHRHRVRFGVLTNFTDWRFYAAGAAVHALTRDRIVEICALTLSRRTDLAMLRHLLDASDSQQRRSLHARFAATPVVISRVIAGSSAVRMALRRELLNEVGRTLRAAQIPDLRVPLLNYFENHLWEPVGSLSRPAIVRALRTGSVVGSIDRAIACETGVAGHSLAVRRAIDAMIRGAERTLRQRRGRSRR